MADATCVWSHNTDDDSGLWETSCGNAFSFNDGGPKENKARFCCYCGKPLEERVYNDDDADGVEVGINGLTEAETSATASVFGLTSDGAQATAGYAQGGFVNGGAYVIGERPNEETSPPWPRPADVTAAPARPVIFCSGPHHEPCPECVKAGRCAIAADAAFRHDPSCGARFATAGECTCGVSAAPAPHYWCNKCGYSGPVQIGHQRPNGSGECNYIAALVKPTDGVKETERG